MPDGDEGYQQRAHAFFQKAFKTSQRCKDFYANDDPRTLIVSMLILEAHAALSSSANFEARRHFMTQLLTACTLAHEGLEHRAASHSKFLSHVSDADFKVMLSMVSKSDSLTSHDTVEDYAASYLSANANGRPVSIIYDNAKEVVIASLSKEGQSRHTFPLWVIGRRPADHEEAWRLQAIVNDLVEAVTFEIDQLM